MQGYKLAEGQYKTDKPTTDKMWDTFNWLFSSYSRNDTSYKFLFLKSIIDCIDKKDARGRITFDVLFERYTRLAWPLVLKYKLSQKAQASDGRKSTLENVLNNRYDSYVDFDELFDQEQKKIIHAIKLECKKYVVGALYGDTNGYLYSFSKKEERIELNPLMERFLKDNKGLIENLNYYKWAKFYENVNGKEKECGIKEKFKFDNVRRNETIYRTILAQEFESLNAIDEHTENTLDFILNADMVADLGGAIDETIIEEELYKDCSNMKRYLNDPILLIKQLKIEKGIK